MRLHGRRCVSTLLGSLRPSCWDTLTCSLFLCPHEVILSVLHSKGKRKCILFLKYSQLMIGHAVRKIEISPDVFMEYHRISILCFFRFSYSPIYYERDGSQLIPLRETDVSRLSPWKKVPFLDRFGWTIPILFGLCWLICQIF